MTCVGPEKNEVNTHCMNSQQHTWELSTELDFKHEKYARSCLTLRTSVVFEVKVLFIIYECLGLILGVFPSDLVCDSLLFREMLLVLVLNTLTFSFPVSCFLIGIL